MTQAITLHLKKCSPPPPHATHNYEGELYLTYNSCYCCPARFPRDSMLYLSPFILYQSVYIYKYIKLQNIIIFHFLKIFTESLFLNLKSTKICHKMRVQLQEKNRKNELKTQLFDCLPNEIVQVVCKSNSWKTVTAWWFLQ